jgi:hypothetical protein
MATYAPLEPSNLQDLVGNTPTYNGSDFSLFTVSTFLYTLLFSAIIAAAFYRYTVAGLTRIQASEASIRKSNEIFKTVSLGLLGVFSLFLILFTVNKDLVTGDVGLEKLKTGGVVAVGGSKEVANAPSPAVGSPSGNSEIQNAINDDARVRADLKKSGIDVNKNVCPNTQATNCTTVGGLPLDTIAMLKNLRSVCKNGVITITGGTEPGHETHGPNKNPVDISISDTQLNACITSFKKGPNVGTWCKRTYSNFGYIFCDENNTQAHWHIYK